MWACAAFEYAVHPDRVAADGRERGSCFVMAPPSLAQCALRLNSPRSQRRATDGNRSQPGPIARGAPAADAAAPYPIPSGDMLTRRRRISVSRRVEGHDIAARLPDMSDFDCVRFTERQQVLAHIAQASHKPVLPFLGFTGSATEFGGVLHLFLSDDLCDCFCIHLVSALLTSALEPTATSARFSSLSQVSDYVCGAVGSPRLFDLRIARAAPMNPPDGSQPESMRPSSSLRGNQETTNPGWHHSSSAVLRSPSRIVSRNSSCMGFSTRKVEQYARANAARCSSVTISSNGAAWLIFYVTPPSPGASPPAPWRGRRSGGAGSRARHRPRRSGSRDPGSQGRWHRRRRP